MEEAQRKSSSELLPNLSPLQAYHCILNMSLSNKLAISDVDLKDKKVLIRYVENGGKNDRIDLSL